MKKWRSPHDGAAPDQQKKNALTIAIVLSFLAFAVQLIGAFYTGSVALLGDTAHLFTDLFSLAMSYFALTLASRPTTEVRSFGLYRLEVLASFLNALMLLLVSLGLIWESVERLRTPKEILALPLLVVAMAGLLLNLLSALALYRAMKAGADISHSHHGHECEHSHHMEAHHDDRNIRAALLHVVSDALGSMAVIVGAVIIHFTGYMRLDAWIGIVLSCVISYWSLRLLFDTTHVLLESTPKHIEPVTLLRDMRALDSRIRRVEDVHVWEITSRMYAASGEISVTDMTLQEANVLREKVLEFLETRYGIAHAVISVKPLPLFFPENS